MPFFTYFWHLKITNRAFKVSWVALFSTTITDFEQVIIKNSHFTDFEHVKKTNNKTPVGETGYLCIFFLFRPLPHVNGTPPWLLRPMRVSTSSELYPNTWLFFFECIGIQFFNSLTCDLRTPCHARGHLHSHSHSYLGKQCISLGVTIILSMCFCSHT